MKTDFHTIIVGSGSGGLTVAVGLSKLGKKVALIEKHHVGGDCTNVGCIPSKALIHASHGEFTEGTEVLSWVRERRDHLRDEETQWVQELKNVTFIRGHARFRDTHTLRVEQQGEERTVSAKNIVLATGSRPRTLEIPGLTEADTLTNETIFEQTQAPDHLVIVGAGVIGLEMAFAFRRLGSQVSILDRGERVLKVAEPEVSDVLHQRLDEVGAKVYFAAQAQSFDQPSRSLQLTDGRVIKGVGKVLIAAGRVPNLDLDLEAAGVKRDKRGVLTNEASASNVPNIFAIGDINHRSAFTHSANHQGRRLVKALAFPFLPAGGAQPHYPSATFTDPEVAQVGPSLAQLRKMYPPQLLRTQKIDLANTDRGYTMDLQHGFVMITALAVTGRTLSATIVAPKAGEMISLLTYAVNNGVSMYKLADLVFPYPVLSDAIKKAANGFVFETLGALPKEVLKFLRYRWF